jgi:hypothetical protein
MLRRRSRHGTNLGDRHVAAAQDDDLAPFDALEVVREPRLGLSDVDLYHGLILDHFSDLIKAAAA